MTDPRQCPGQQRQRPASQFAALDLDLADGGADYDRIVLGAMPRNSFSLTMSTSLVGRANRMPASVSAFARPQ
jgi:hypothetical protein